MKIKANKTFVQTGSASNAKYFPIAPNVEFQGAADPEMQGQGRVLQWAGEGGGCPQGSLGRKSK